MNPTWLFWDFSLPNFKFCSFNGVFMGTLEFLAGVGIGYFLAEAIAKDVGPQHVLGTRIHHYNALWGAFFTDSDFKKGLAIGIGIHDLPDLIDDLDRWFNSLK